MSPAKQDEKKVPQRFKLYFDLLRRFKSFIIIVIKVRYCIRKIN
jgi:hypothetical protein